MTKPRSISPQEYALAKRVLNQGELDVWKLHHYGHSYRRISLALNIHKSTVANRLHNAQRKLEHATEEAA